LNDLTAGLNLPSFGNSATHPGNVAAAGGEVITNPEKLSDSGRSAPLVSVLMATYNGERYIRQSIDSILSQSFADIELIIVDDASTDTTPDILRSYSDARLRVLRNGSNLGVVASRNRAFAASRGSYILSHDHDDLSRPRRIEKQVAHLDSHPETVLAGTATHAFRAGKVYPIADHTHGDPLMIKWMLHIANPITQSSIMFRRAAIESAGGVFMREDFTYSDDYDLYHRLLRHGNIVRLPDYLTVYRIHPENTSLKYEEIMIRNAIKVLLPSYSAWFGDEAQDAASLVVRHLSARRPATTLDVLDRLGRYLETLIVAFAKDNNVDDADRRRITKSAAQLWWLAISQGAQHGVAGAYALFPTRIISATDWRPTWQQRLNSYLRTSPLARRVWIACAALLARAGSHWAALSPRPTRLFDRDAVPVDFDADRMPTLFVVIDTEAEFDWTSSFVREMTGVENIAALDLAQNIFNEYGLRPVCVVDYPVASNPQSSEIIRRLAHRRMCEVGVHLQPWTNPPFEEELSEHNSFPGNLPRHLEERKLGELYGCIEKFLGARPIFYKAGRYGFGPNTADLLVRHGLKVDFSLLPETDATYRGGPDCRDIISTPYWLAEHRLVSAPMSRSHIGPLWALGARAVGLLTSSAAARLRITGLLSRLRLLERITLTPEGFNAKQQIRLIKALHRRGRRAFVLHYHSPSLVAGNTPYVRTAADLNDFLARLRDVCKFFFDEFGGIPGNPRDLLPPEQRGDQSRIYAANIGA
jgi:glycosyltransferase involved in cell wall biosynthesis